MENVNILCLFDLLSEEQLKELEQTYPVNIMNISSEKAANKDVSAVDAVWGWPEEKLLARASNLRWLQLGSAGAGSYTDPDLYVRDDAVLCSASGVYGPPIAEHILGLILAFNRKLHTYIRQQEDNYWERYSIERDFAGSTVGIVGLGDIGLTFAQKAELMGVKEILAIKKNPDQKPDCVDRLFGPGGLHTVLDEAENVVLALPLTDETRGLIGRKELQKMGEDTFLVNVGRGPLIEREALLEALKENWIAGAGLDVTDPEPLPEDDPLWDFEQVIITPHNSGFSPSNGERLYAIIRENLDRFIQGRKLINTVDFEAGY